MQKKFTLLLIGLVSFSFMPVCTQAQLFDKIKKKANDVINKASEKPAGSKQTEPAKRDTVPDENKKSTSKSASEGQSLDAYQNYDFVPGENIVFEDDFAGDELGEFPSHWSLVDGQATLNVVDDKRALLISSNGTYVKPLIKNPTYLTDTFTIEFDHFVKSGWGFVVYFYPNDKVIKGSDQAIGYVDFCSACSWNSVTTWVQGESSKTVALPTAIAGENIFNKWHHIAIIYKNKRLKIYIDQYRVISLPEFNATPRAFAIKGDAYYKPPYGFANVRVANGGGMKTNEKKFSDPKIITHINFDVDKASIKPESMGILNNVAEILRNNPQLKFEIQGHTDNTGNATHNLSLSQQRAEAVRNQLIQMGIEDGRLTAKGLGDTKPIADNSTMEGKANNRRVEFVKL
jgi:OmpA-OmpF porin, OOP family